MNQARVPQAPAGNPSRSLRDSGKRDQIAVMLEMYAHGDDASHRDGIGEAAGSCSEPVKPAVAVKRPDEGFEPGGPR